MSYSSNPYAAKARFEAAKLVVKQGLRASQVAKMYGVHRSTIGKWVKRFPRRLNQYGHFISTLSSAAKYHPNQLPDEVINKVVNLRIKLHRCAPVIHAHLVNQGINISLSSVGRILKRQGLIRKKKQSTYLKSLYPRPPVDSPGSLVQMDTIHFVRGDGSRFYIYTLIDVYSRLAYAEYHLKLSQDIAFKVIRNAQKYLKFNFSMIQTDHGPEFRSRFLFLLSQLDIKLRHSRIRKPNDNAHIERFNRTIQEECFNGVFPKESTSQEEIRKYLEYYNNFRLHLSLNLLTPSQFVAKALN